jgi:hypothetical protein
VLSPLSLGAGVFISALSTGWRVAGILGGIGGACVSIKNFKDLNALSDAI